MLLNIKVIKKIYKAIGFGRERYICEMMCGRRRTPTITAHIWIVYSQKAFVVTLECNPLYLKM